MSRPFASPLSSGAELCRAAAIERRTVPPPLIVTDRSVRCACWQCRRGSAYAPCTAQEPNCKNRIGRRRHPFNGRRRRGRSNDGAISVTQARGTAQARDLQTGAQDACGKVQSKAARRHRQGDNGLSGRCRGRGRRSGWRSLGAFRRHHALAQLRGPASEHGVNPFRRATAARRGASPSAARRRAGR